MLLKCAASGSKGNSYALETVNEILLLEAGMKMIDVKKNIDFKVSKIAGCLLSHEHG